MRATAAVRTAMLRTCNTDTADQAGDGEQNHCKSFHKVPPSGTAVRLDPRTRVRQKTPLSIHPASQGKQPSGFKPSTDLSGRPIQSSLLQSLPSSLGSKPWQSKPAPAPAKPGWTRP